MLLRGLFKMLFCLLLLCYCCTSGIFSYAQQSSFSNIVKKNIPVSASPLVLDSLSIAWGSLQIENVADSFYAFDYAKNTISFRNVHLLKDSVSLQYRTLPFLFSKRYFNKNPKLIDSNFVFDNGYRYDGATLGKDSNFVHFNSIEYNGSYGRSLSVGNNQDVVLNSQFNLQLNGYVLDSVRIEAVITDNNIPFQPEGNTQRLQEFDKMYITFEKGLHKLTAGDYSQERPKSYFLNFNKRVQGLQYEGTVINKKNLVNRVGLSGSIAKGQFNRNIFQGIEGNQGPYKLTGQNGEQFFIVLAGSERVFIDGELMLRGEDLDYIINYNTAEIIFMPRRLITKDKRIQVDFEYQNRNYLNTLFFVEDELQIGKKWNVRLNAYSNQDAKNQTYMQSLSGAQKRFLQGIGDNTDQAFYPSAQIDTFAPNKILYKLVDTVVDGVSYDSVFVYSTHPDSAKYTLNFTFVGPGKGNYNISELNTNGRSYTWTAPKNGIRQGSYEPVILLVTPKMHQVFTAATTYKIDSLKAIDVELAMSNYSPNTFSTKDNSKHWGAAMRAAYNEIRFLGKRDTLGIQKWKWSNKLAYEFVEDRFVAIAPYRNVEFARDWNVDTVKSPSKEHLITAATSVERLAFGSIGYEFTHYTRGNFYQANRNLLSYNIHKKYFRLGGSSSLMTATSNVRNSTFFRPSIFIEKDIFPKKTLTLGVRYDKEYNAVKDKLGDTLLRYANNFDLTKIYLRTLGEKGLSINLDYGFRRDFAPVKNEFLQKNHAHTIDLKMNITRWKGHQLGFTGAYRNLKVDRAALSAEQAGETVLGRLEYNATIKNGFLIPSLLYDFGTGQEPKRQFTYVEVPAGQGVYMWIDYNNDGVQQANEFEIAVFKDQKRFIRVITPTSEYVKVNFANLNLSLQINPENLWTSDRERSGAKLFLSRWSNQLALQINNRTLNSIGLRAFNPFATNIIDTAVIAGLTTLSNTVSLNRNSAKWGLDYTTAYNFSKSLLTYGLESNSQLRHIEKLRVVLNKQFTFQLTGMQGYRAFASALEDGRSYHITIHAVEPSLTFLANSNLRIMGLYRFENRQNRPVFGGEKAVQHNAGLDLRISFPSSGVIQFRGTYSNIFYNGSASSPTGFVMLESLQKGNNLLWYINWAKRISKSIELSLEYDGRKPGTQRIVHTGTMSLRAIL